MQSSKTLSQPKRVTFEEVNLKFTNGIKQQFSNLLVGKVSSYNWEDE